MQTIKKVNDEQIKTEKEKEKLKEEVRYWQTRAQGFEQEKNFLQTQIIDSKRQNKLLKLAIGRLQDEIEQKDGVVKQLSIMQEGGIGGDGTFMTEAKDNIQVMGTNTEDIEASVISAPATALKAQ